MVIDVVGGPKDGILEAIDELLIPADDILLLANHALNQFLSGTQVLHHETEIGILLIVFLQFSVHGLRGSP